MLSRLLCGAALQGILISCSICPVKQLHVEFEGRLKPLPLPVGAAADIMLDSFLGGAGIGKVCDSPLVVLITHTIPTRIKTTIVFFAT